MDALISDGQRYALNKLIGSMTEGRAMRLYVISALVGREITTTAVLYRAEWCLVRNAAYPDWRSGDWTVSNAFRSRVSVLVRNYCEEVGGQLRLF